MSGHQTNRFQLDPSLLKRCFGLLTDKVAGRLHLIAESGYELGQVIRQVFGDDLALWPYPNVFEPGESKSPDELARTFSEQWLTNDCERNYLDQMLGVMDTWPLNIVIERQTSRDVLARMYQRREDPSWHLERFWNHEDSFPALGSLLDWVDDLGWFAMPIEPEGDWTLFVFANDRQDIRSELQKNLNALGLRFVHLENTPESSD